MEISFTTRDGRRLTREVLSNAPDCRGWAEPKWLHDGHDGYFLVGRRPMRRGDLVKEWHEILYLHRDEQLHFDNEGAAFAQRRSDA